MAQGHDGNARDHYEANYSSVQAVPDPSRRKREDDVVAPSVDDNTEKVAVHADRMPFTSVLGDAPAGMKALGDHEQLAPLTLRFQD
jgi:hypothetical protein